MPQTSAPSPRPQSARRTGQRMDFAPRRGNAAPQSRPATPAAAKPATSATKPTSRPAAKPSPRPVSRRPAAKPSPKPVSSRPAQTAPRPATPRRPALITSAREAMNAHARALREAQLETQSATQPATQRSAHPATSSAVAPEQGIAAPTSPRSAHNLHHGSAGRLHLLCLCLCLPGQPAAPDKLETARHGGCKGLTEAAPPRAPFHLQKRGAPADSWPIGLRMADLLSTCRFDTISRCHSRYGQRNRTVG